MDKKDSDIYVHPTPKITNNLKKEPSQEQRKNGMLGPNGGIYYRETLEAMLEDAIKIQQLKQKINELERRLIQLEKSKIVSAPLKPDVILKDVKIVDANELNKTAKNRMAIDSYTNSVKQAQDITHHVILPEEPEEPKKEEKKISFWQKIKNAIKLIFSDEPEQKENDIQPNYIGEFDENNWSRRSYRYNNFRDNVPKTEIKIDSKKKDNTPKEPSEHILDRYV